LADTANTEVEFVMAEMKQRSSIILAKKYVLCNPCNTYNVCVQC